MALITVPLVAALGSEGGPPPPNCAQYHELGRGEYDPSGPLLMDDGTWHVFPDGGHWGHCTSRDLLHWDCNHNSTGFNGDTGALSATPAGIFALWPVVGRPAGILMAVPTDSSLEHWTQKGVIGVPTDAGGGFRDPGRAMQLASGWYVPAGVGGIHWFRADGDQMTNLTWTGKLVPDGLDGITEFECPDVFPLDGKVVVMVSTQGKKGWTQYWVGDISQNDSTFIPDYTDRLEHGADGISTIYAAKTGTSTKPPFTRRVVFGFDGWSAGDATSCGRSYLLPKELSLSGGRLMQRPIRELENLRQEKAPASTIAAGAQIEVIVKCQLPSPPPRSGLLAVNTLIGGTNDQSDGVQVGYDFGAMQGFAKVPPSLGAHGTDPRTDSVNLTDIMTRGGTIELRVFVDGHLVETFFDGYSVISTVTHNQLPSANLSSTLINSAKLADCDVSSWALGLYPPGAPTPAPPAPHPHPPSPTPSPAPAAHCKAPEAGDVMGMWSCEDYNNAGQLWDFVLAEGTNASFIALRSDPTLVVSFDGVDPSGDKRPHVVLAKKPNGGAPDGVEAPPTFVGLADGASGNIRVASGPYEGSCLDVTDHSMRPGAPIQSYNCGSWYNQKWAYHTSHTGQLTSLSDPQHHYGGKCLTACPL